MAEKEIHTLQSEGLVPISLDVPFLEPAQGLVGLMFNFALSTRYVLRDPMFSHTDDRLELMTHHLISVLVPTKKAQKTFRDRLDRELKEQLKDITDNKERGKIRNRICIGIEGDVFAHMHNVLGTTKENKIGIVWNPEDCKVVDFRKVEEIKEDDNPATDSVLQ